MPHRPTVLAVVALTLTLTVPGGAAAGAAPSLAGPTNPAQVYAYLENPRMVAEGQVPAHALLRPYGDAPTAIADVTEHSAASPWTASLNGDWKLRVVNRPESVPAGFHGADYDVSGWPTASVPHTWQSDFLDHPMFRNVPEELWPDDPPKVPHDINPTGAYVRTFEMPESWDGRRSLLRFEGVTSGYFVWVNGQYIGYDQGGYTPAEFDVTSAVQPGANRVAVQVHRWGSGSYLEDVDQWRYSGIFRDVWLYSAPQTRLNDLYVTTDVNGANSRLSARVDLTRSGGATGEYTVRGRLIGGGGADKVVTAKVNVTGGSARTTLSTTVANPALWSAEDPNLYTLLLELIDPAGTVIHITSQAVGFREVAVANKTVLVNGKRILVKGVNRAETDPDTGRYASRAAQRRDVFLMKSLHVNGVRTAHYPSDPYFYDLADKHGLWIADEVDIETHAHQSCPANCLASKPEWQDAFADRFRAMVARDKNHPSVIFWDTGNEAGLGTAHHAMAEWATANDPTRLLYHQSNSPNGDAPFAHVNGIRYPEPGELETKAKTIAKPIVMGEYAHAMGNGLGNFTQFWDLVRKYPQIQGGFIWDWAEQDLRQPLIFTPDSSANRIQTFLVGKPSQVTGRRGKAVALSGLDDFVNTFRHSKLDITGTKLTLDAWVKPGTWGGSFPILTKGNQYALQMRDKQTLEFGVNTGSWTAVSAAVPANWSGNWHRVTGVYDGAALRLYIDGKPAANTAKTGRLKPGLFELNLGRNSETQWDQTKTRLGAGVLDDVRVYSRALTAAQLAAGADPAETAALALNFDKFTAAGDFLNLGVYLSGTDGLIGSDRTLQPEVVEMAWAQAPVRFTAVDVAAGKVRVHNEQQAGALDVQVRWSQAEIDRTLRSGTQALHLNPGQSVELNLGGAGPNPRDAERWLNLAAVTTTDLPWAKAGWKLGYDQFDAGGKNVPGVALPPSTKPAPEVTRTSSEVTVTGSGWTYRFDTVAGTLSSMVSGGNELLRRGPALDAHRTPISNETFRWGGADRQIWHTLGLDRLRTKVSGVTTSSEGGAAIVEVRSTAAGPDTAAKLSFDQAMRYRIDRDGTIALTHSVTPKGTGIGSLTYLPRIGFKLQVPSAMQRFAWYGRGFEENYNDRKAGTPVGLWRSTVDEQYVPYARPQAYGNHTDTRWATLSSAEAGLVVAGNVNVSVSPYDSLSRAEYGFQLPLVRNDGWVTLHVGHGETGVGETPNSTQAEFRVAANKSYSYQVVLRPLTATEVSVGGVLDSR